MALAMSRQADGTAGQDALKGVKSPSVQFGPANRNHYDARDWAVTTSTTREQPFTEEILPDVNAPMRKHHGYEPRFLKPSLAGDYLSSFLTIAHAIPLAREALLASKYDLMSYGQDADWWRGHAINLSTITTDDVNIESISSASMHISRNYIIEMQRLMAFLDSSDRSYACTEGLLRLPNHADTEGLSSPESILDRVMHQWESAVQPTQDVSHVFHSVIGNTNPEAIRTPHMWSLPLNISIDDRPENGVLTLTDIMTNALWETDPNDPNQWDTFIEQEAKVLAMRITQDEPVTDKLQIIAPSELYIDKYLKANIEATRHIRRDMVGLRRRIIQIETIQNRLVKMDHPSKIEKVELSALVKSAMAFLMGTTREAVIAENDARGIDIPVQQIYLPQKEQYDYNMVALKLEEILNSVFQRLKVLEDEKQKTKDLLAGLVSSRPEGFNGMEHRYALRGVSTKPNITYILKPRPVITSDDGMTKTYANTDFDDEDAPEGWMWWRLEYDTSSAMPRILKTESTQDDVLRAAELEHTSALLVYASDDAMSTPEIPSELSQPLKEFIKNDNNLFQQDLLNQETPPTSYNWANNNNNSNNDGWIDVYSPRSAKRRESNGSTFVNHEDVLDQDPPPYDFGANGSYTWNDQVALGASDQDHFIHSSHNNGGWNSPEAHEIRLDEEIIDVQHERGRVSPSIPDVEQDQQQMTLATAGVKRQHGSADTITDSSAQEPKKNSTEARKDSLDKVAGGHNSTL